MGCGRFPGGQALRLQQTRLAARQRPFKELLEHRPHRGHLRSAKPRTHGSGARRAIGENLLNSQLHLVCSLVVATLRWSWTSGGVAFVASRILASRDLRLASLRGSSIHFSKK